MFARSAKEAAEAVIVLQLCLGDNAPHGLIDLFTGGSAPTSSPA